MEEKRREAGNLPTDSTESPTTESASLRRRGGAQKRKVNSLNSSNSTATPSKRLTREKAQLSHPPIHNGPLTRARQAPNNVSAAASILFADAGEADSSVKQSELTVKKECSGAESGASHEELNKENVREALEALLEAEYEAIRSRGTNAHVVPNHCGWFSWEAIHPIEERMLPAFFNGQTENRSPDIYMKIRNWIVKKFQASPNAHISLEDMSELDVGSLDARQEVMEFLDYWGLINFHPFPSADPVTANDDDDDGEAQKNFILEKLYHFEMQQGNQPPTPKALTPKSSAPAISSTLFPDPSIAEELIKPEGPSVEYHCNSCSADCSRKRYHCQKQADFDLCFDCFSDGKFDSNMSSSDFILMESAEAPGLSGGKWTDQETLLLLEALELYRENWNEIAEHVATKTKAQCILHFLQMPIEDAFLNYDDHSDAISNQPTYASGVNTLSSIKKANETIENKTTGDEGQVPTQTEVSKFDNRSEVKLGEETPKADDTVEGKTNDGSSQSADSSEAKITHESTDDCAFKALTEAFEAIGYAPGPDGPHSFAELGNPVLALAIFLGRLVRSDLGFASSHACLKSISGNSPSVELAARNCFLLEDPPTDRDHQKHIEVDEKNEKQVIANFVSDKLSDDDDKKIDRADSEDKKLPISPRMECSETPDTVTNDKEVGLQNLSEVMNQSDNSASAVEQATVSQGSGGTSIKGPAQSTKERNDAEESNLPSDKNEPQHSIAKKASPDQSGSFEAAKDVELVLEPGTSENNKSQKLQSSDSAAESSQPMDADTMVHSLQLKNEQKLKIPTKPSPQQKSKENVDSTPQSLLLESDDFSQPIRLSSKIKVGENRGDGPKEEPNQLKTECTKPGRSEKMKRAAISVLTAAAVKAKVLADREEDQIRQLTAFLIEKQLHKLEAKLAFFNDMENVVMRTRENLDRIRQKLYHERGQIIASRFGLPPSSSRSMPPSFPANRVPMNFSNSIPRPSMIMPPQRSLHSKPMGTMFSTPPNSLPYATTVGNVTRLASQDKLSSGGTK